MNSISIITTAVAGGFIIYEIIKYTKINIVSKKYAKEYVKQEIKPEIEREKFKIIHFGEVENG